MTVGAIVSFSSPDCDTSVSPIPTGSDSMPMAESSRLLESNSIGNTYPQLPQRDVADPTVLPFFNNVASGSSGALQDGQILAMLQVYQLHTVYRAPMWHDQGEFVIQLWILNSCFVSYEIQIRLSRRQRIRSTKRIDERTDNH